MRKRSLILYVLLLMFWIVISGEMDIKHILIGALLAVITVWFWHDLGPRLPGIPTMKELVYLSYCLILLVSYVIYSNIGVAKTLLFSGKPVDPVFAVMEPPLETNWGRVLLAICITITPGTVVIDVDPDKGRFIVHALTHETAMSLFYWRIIDKIKNLEEYSRRGTEHDLDTGRTHDLDSLGTSKGNHRTDRH